MAYKQQLQAIQKASGWSQEQLAAQLSVTFVTLNSWINERSHPRAKALRNIADLYLTIVGNDVVDEAALSKAKQTATKLKINTKEIIKDKTQLEALTLYLTYHTNTIEGSTMTLSDVEEVLFDHKVLSNRTAIEQAEARNHQATLYWLLDEVATKGKKLVIDESLILGVHLRLMNGLIGDAGQYRKHTVRIMGSHVVLANWIKVPELVNRLATNINKPEDDTIKAIAGTHARFEQIHPFSDGNGRTGRLIMLAQALKANLMPPLIVKERKYAYYKYLEIAQTKEEYGPLELFVAESMVSASELLTIKH